MISKFGKLIAPVFVFILFVVITVTLLTYNNLQILRQNNQLINHTYEIHEVINQMYANFTDAEAAQRSYLFTGNTLYLSKYKNSVPKVNDTIIILQELTKDNPHQQQRIDLLRKLSSQRIARLDEGIRLRDAEGIESAQTYVAEGTGTRIMDSLRKLLTEMKREEATLLHERTQATQRIYQMIYGTVAFGSLLNLCLCILAFYLISQELAKRNNLEKTKDAFINMASHELKTPITSLKVFVQLMNKKINENDLTEAKKYITKVEDQIHRLTILINDLLDLSRIQTGKMRFEKEHIDLDALIKDTVDAIQETTKKHKFIIRGKLHQKVYADRYRIYQVLVNLLTNSIKYTPSGGNITVTVQKRLKIALISVRDSGIGIEKEYQKRIFDRLYQVIEKTPHSPGLGIGLFVASEIIKNHNGIIWVESKKGKGSTFYFTLPFTSQYSLKKNAAALKSFQLTH